MDTQGRASGASDSASKRDSTTSSSSVDVVPIGELLPAADTPRLNGEDPEHVATLASSDAMLPPILVDRRTRRVIDGSHRLKAAVLRGAESIEVVYFDGSPEDAFVAAVEANTAHGLPLSLADRKAAAVRILRSHPDRSDRAIAKTTGLAAKTVAAMRRPSEDAQQLDRRIGQDGRARPRNGAAGRLRAAEVVKKTPDASLREIAHAAGVSPMTARDVRDRLRRGEAPTIANRRHTERTTVSRLRHATRSGSEPTSDPMEILETLLRDPALRQTEVGRALLRRLGIQVRGIADLPTSMRQVPPHSRYMLAELAHSLSLRWRDLAEEIERTL